MNPISVRPPRVLIDRKINGFSVEFRAQYSRRVQKAPYDLPTEYVADHNRYQQSRYDNKYPGSGYGGGAQSMSDVLWHPSYAQAVKNAAYENFRSRLTNQADLGVTFAETSQAIGMLGRAAGTILRSMKAVKSLQFKSAARILGMHFVPPKVNRKRAWADNWLEYQLGWVPFIGTAYDAMEVLNDPIKTFGMAYGRAEHRVSLVQRTDYGSGVRDETRIARYQAEQGGRIRAITNRELMSLEQWGLINPLSVAWELVPFSFVIDWFANVGDVLRSYSDFAGMELEKTYMTMRLLSHVSGLYRVKPGYEWQLPDDWSRSLGYSGYGTYIQRVPGLWAPVLSLRSLRLPSASRVATAVSLITQQTTKSSSWSIARYYR